MHRTLLVKHTKNRYGQPPARVTTYWAMAPNSAPRPAAPHVPPVIHQQTP